MKTSPIRLLAKGFDVSEALQQIEEHPQYWNLIPFRKIKYGTPHNTVDDIWIRYNAWENFDGDHDRFNAQHESTWYPAAYDMPAIQDLAFQVMSVVHGTRLGGILITRIPVGSMVEPHIDGGWHAHKYRKFAIQLKGNAKQAFCFEETSLVTFPGDLYEFRNDIPHWVTNDSDEERMTLIICIETT